MTRMDDPGFVARAHDQSDSRAGSIEHLNSVSLRGSGSYCSAGSSYGTNGRANGNDYCHPPVSEYSEDVKLSELAPLLPTTTSAGAGGGPPLSSSSSSSKAVGVNGACLSPRSGDSDEAAIETESAAALSAKARLLGEASAVKAQSGIFVSMVSLMGLNMGSALLSQPYALRQAGVVPGLVSLAVVSGLCYLTQLAVTECARSTGALHFDDLSRLLLGPRMTLFVRVCLGIVLGGAVVMYQTVALDIFTPLLGPALGLSRGWLAVLLTAASVPMGLPESLHALRYVSTAVSACLVAIVALVLVRAGETLAAAGSDPLASNPWEQLPWLPASWLLGVAGLASALPLQTGGYGCQLNTAQVFVELQDKRQMAFINQAVVLSGMAIYAAFSLAGMLIFQGAPPDDLLSGFGAGDGVMTGARLVLGACMLFKIPVGYFPLREMLESACYGGLHNVTRARRLRLTMAVMLMVLLAGLCLGRLSVVLQVMMGSGGVWITYAVPGLFLYSAAQLGYFEEPRAKYYRAIGVLVMVASVTISLLAGMAAISVMIQ